MVAAGYDRPLLYHTHYSLTLLGVSLYCITHLPVGEQSHRSHYFSKKSIIVVSLTMQPESRRIGSPDSLHHSEQHSIDSCTWIDLSVDVTSF